MTMDKRTEEERALNRFKKEDVLQKAAFQIQQAIYLHCRHFNSFKESVKMWTRQKINYPAS
jgi:hypothetical protein